ncbi:MAG: NAD-dependent epimerase/dehydratase family protein [Solirubrobacterales bacterium]
MAGATGAVGRPLCAQLFDAGHEVVGLTRSAEKATGLASRGVEPVVADALDASAVAAAVADAQPEVVVSQLTDLPADFNAAGDRAAANDRVREQGTRNLLVAARASGARRIVAQSLGFAYRPGGTGLATEDEPLYADGPSPLDATVRSLEVMESEVLGVQELGGVVLRYGFFYGPGSWYGKGGSAVHDLRRRRLPKVGAGEGVWSFCHVDDAASACVTAVEGTATGTFNICDDHPAAVAEWLPTLAHAAGAPPPLRAPALVARLVAGRYPAYLMTEVRGAANDRAKRELGWSPRWPDWRDGFREGLAPE